MSLSAGSHSHSARLAQAKIQTSRQLLFYLSLSLSLLANNTALEEAIIHLMFPAIFTQGRQSLSWVALSFALYYSLSLSSSPKVLRCEKKKMMMGYSLGMIHLHWKYGRRTMSKNGCPWLLWWWWTSSSSSSLARRGKQKCHERESEVSIWIINWLCSSRKGSFSFRCCAVQPRASFIFSPSA